MIKNIFFFLIFMVLAMYSNGYESLFVVDNETCLATNEVCSEVNIESNNFSPVCVLKNNRSNIIEIFVEGEYTYNSFNQKENIRVYYNLEGKVYLHSSEFVVKKDGVEKEFKNAGTYTIEVIKSLGGCTFTSASLIMNKKVIDSAKDVKFEDKVVKYDGCTHSISLTGISEELVRIEYTRNNFMYASDSPYEIIATLTLIDVVNYTLTKDVFTAYLTIQKGHIDMSQVTFENVAETYTGKGIGVSVGGNLPAGVSVTYEFYCNNERVYNLPVNVGKYMVVAKFMLYTADYYNYNKIPDMVAEIQILPAKIDCSEVVFEDSEVKFNNTIHNIVGKNIPSNVVAIYTYLDTGLIFNGEKNVGNYDIKLTLSTVSENVSIYNFSDAVATLKITPGDIDMSGVYFNDITFQYDGKSHSPELIGTIPSNVKVQLEFNKNVDVGEHICYAHFQSTDSNYLSPESMNCKVVITPKPLTVNFKNHYTSGVNKYFEFIFDGILGEDCLEVDLKCNKYVVDTKWYLKTNLSVTNSKNYIFENKYSDAIFEIVSSSKVYNEISFVVSKTINKNINTLKITEGKTLEINSTMRTLDINTEDYEVLLGSESAYTFSLKESALKTPTRYLNLYIIEEGNLIKLEYNVIDGVIVASIPDASNVIIVMRDNNMTRNIIILIVYLILTISTLATIIIISIKYFRQ